LPVEHTAKLLQPLVRELGQRQPCIGRVDLVDTQLPHLSQLCCPYGRGGLQGRGAIRSMAAEGEHIATDRPSLRCEHRCPSMTRNNSIDPIGLMAVGKLGTLPGSSTGSSTQMAGASVTGSRRGRIRRRTLPHSRTPAPLHPCTPAPLHPCTPARAASRALLAIATNRPRFARG